MSIRYTTRAFVKLCSSTHQRAVPSFRNIYSLNHKYANELYNPNVCYTQRRYIFWNEKKGEEGKTEQTQEQTENKTEQTAQESKKTQEEPKQEQKQQQQTNKTETQDKQQTKEKPLAAQFEDLIHDVNPELSGKLHNLWRKLERVNETATSQTKKLKDQNDTLEKGIHELKQKIEDLRIRLKEEIEEGELRRKRFEKELDQNKIYAITKFAKDLIEVPDNLGRALESAKGLEGKGDNLYEGVKATNAILLKTLQRHGITQLNPIGEKFDPNYHEALFDVPDPSARPGTCGFVVNVGYKINDRILRPAKVGVVKGDYVETAEEKAAREAKKN